MKKIAILDNDKILEAKGLCSTLCGCADNISFSDGDSDTAEAIDLVESGVTKILEEAKVLEVDEIMGAWFCKLCNQEIDNINQMIRQENLWALGSANKEQSETHVQNMVRLEQYKLLLDNLKKAVLV